MLTLAIETSAGMGSLALLDGDRLLAERTLEFGARHGQALIPELRQLLESARLSPEDCALTAVSVGPGSFTGLRVGIVCAKVWAYVTKCSLVGVDTHRAIAANSPAEVDCVHVISPSQGGDLFFSRHLRGEGNTWIETEPLAYLPAADWFAQLRPEEIISGPALGKLTAELGAKCRLLPQEYWVPKARQVGRLGLLLHQGGEVSDPWALEPRYLRRSSAEEKWDLRRRV